MNDREFKELVDLYLDKEIEGKSIQRPMDAIAADPCRRREFDSACQLHHAMRLALGKEVAANEARSPLPHRRWQVALAMVASFVLGAFFLAPAFHESDHIESLVMELSDPSSQSGGEDSMKTLPKSFQNYLGRLSRKDAEKSHSSLAARLRLAGLSPDLAPLDARLQAVEIRSHNVHLSWDEQVGGWRVHRNCSSLHHLAHPNINFIEDGIFMADFPDRAQFEDPSPKQMVAAPLQLDVWLVEGQDH